jgi:hypothetical protein
VWISSDMAGGAGSPLGAVAMLRLWENLFEGNSAHMMYTLTIILHDAWYVERRLFVRRPACVVLQCYKLQVRVYD